MSRSDRRSVARHAFASVLAALFMAGAAGAAIAAPGAQNVIVTNPPSSPVPVNGSVEITGTVPVSGNVGITGTVPVSGNVGITGTPSVNVLNTSANPVLVKDASASDRFVAQLNLNNVFVVAAGKIAVLEFVSGTCVWNPSDGVIDLAIQIWNPEFDHEIVLIPHVNSTTALHAYVAFSQSVRDYINPGWYFTINADLLSGFQPSSCSATVAGYYLTQQ